MPDTSCNCETIVKKFKEYGFEIFKPINYYTYNSRNVFLAVFISVLFFAFYAILYLAFSYETSNRADICNPTFYYGNACRRQIARTALLDTSFLPLKKSYYSNVQDSVNPRLTTDDTNKIEEVNNVVQDYLSENKTFNDETIQEIEDLTDVLNLISTKYLGNIQDYLATQTESSSVSHALQNIPSMLQYIQEKMNKAIIEPTSARFVSPLKKLYQALSSIQS